MKNNIFKKVLAGFAAFAMVATMMPGLAQDAKAAGMPIYLVNGKTATDPATAWGKNSSPAFTVSVDGKELDAGNKNVVLTPETSEGQPDDIVLTVTLNEGYELTGAAPVVNVYTPASEVTNPSDSGNTDLGAAVASATVAVSNGGETGPWSYKIPVDKYATGAGTPVVYTADKYVYIAVTGARQVNRAIFNGSKSGDDITIRYRNEGGTAAYPNTSTGLEMRTKYTGRATVTGSNTNPNYDASDVTSEFARYTDAAGATVNPTAGDPATATHFAYRGGITAPMIESDILVTSSEIESSARAIDKVILNLVTNDDDIKEAIANGDPVPDPEFGDDIELQVSKREGNIVDVTNGVVYTIPKDTLVHDAKITVTLKSAEEVTITLEGDEGILFSTSADAYIEAPKTLTVRKGGTLAEALINAFPNNPRTPSAYTVDGLFAMVSKEKNPLSEGGTPIFDYIVDGDESYFVVGEKEPVKNPDDQFLNPVVNDRATLASGGTTAVYAKALTEDTTFHVALTFAKPKNITFTQDGQLPSAVRVTDAEDAVITTKGAEYKNPSDEFKFKVDATRSNVKVTKVSYAIGTKGAVEIKADADGFYTIPANTIDADTVVNVATGLTKKVTVVGGELQDKTTDLYAVGEKVGITATAPEGKTFDKWTSEQDVIFEGATAESTRFTMTDEDITVTATFKDAEKKNFVDVVAGSWYEAAVNWAVENGITEGVDATHFGVGQDLTRGQAAVFLAAYAKATLTEPTEKPFPDVELGQWYTKQMAWAKEKGVMSGYDNGNGGPNDPVTRIQAALMMRMLADPNGTGDKTFPDVTAAWMIPGAQWAGTNGIIKGDEAGNFNPNAVCKREQFVVMMKALNEKFPPKADDSKAEENKTDESKTDENKTDESKEGETTTP